MRITTATTITTMIMTTDTITLRTPAEPLV